MTTVSQNFALNLSKVKIVRSKDERYFGDGNSVPTIKFPHSLSFRAAKLARRSTSYVFTGGAEDSGHSHCRCRAGAERYQQQQEEESEEESEDMAAFDLAAVDDRIAKISAAIRVIPDFPKPGIMFQDITTLLLDWKAFKDTIDLFVERYKEKNISVVAGVEARGFIFGPPIALAIGAKFVPMRKPKKLPGEVISEEYSLEYGTDRIEMHVGAVKEGERALVIDDLIATGGTLCAAIRLLERVGVHVVECACVIELPELKGRERLGDKPLFVLVSSS